MHGKERREYAKFLERRNLIGAEKLAVDQNGGSVMLGSDLRGAGRGS
jgi:hypothetical protein